MLDSIPLPILLVVPLLLYTLLPSRKLPPLPVINLPSSVFFPRLRARFRSTLDFKSAILAADAQHRHKPVILPLLTGDMVLLPRSDIQWVVDQPDAVLNMHDQVLESLQIDHTTPDPELVHHPIHQKIITTTLTNQIGNLVPDVAEETELCVDKFFGDGGDLCVYEAVFKMVGAVSNRVFVGKPGCRDEELLKLGGTFAQIVPSAASVLRMCWGPVKAVVSSGFRIWIWVVAKKFERKIAPEIRKRLDEFDRGVEEKNDFLQWSIK